MNFFEIEIEEVEHNKNNTVHQKSFSISMLRKKLWTAHFLPLCSILYILSLFVPFICVHISLSLSLSLSCSNLAFSLVPRETGLFPWQCLQAEQCICLKLDKIRVSFIPFRHTHTGMQTNTYSTYNMAHSRRAPELEKCVKSRQLAAFRSTHML